MGCSDSKEREAARTDAPSAGVRRKPEPGAHNPAPRLKLVDRLPVLYEKCECRHVYDGDTLTLDDHRRVRLLGVDTPELKDHEPYAEESKEFTSALCSKKTVFLVRDGEQQDKYGRVLAHVYVLDPAGSTKYVCVNEALVDAGLAGFYSLSELTNRETLLALQSGARAARRGKWSKFVDSKVVASQRGRCYHFPTCEHIADLQRPNHLLISEAQDKGLSACRDCHPS